METLDKIGSTLRPRLPEPAARAKHSQYGQDDDSGTSKHPCGKCHGSHHGSVDSPRTEVYWPWLFVETYMDAVQVSVPQDTVVLPSVTETEVAYVRRTSEETSVPPPRDL